ncbi:hypothetical protein SERLA73DRAFT_173656 [Serpula lacrymans var. lacrymans S7.3]|uniref:Ribosome assembly protein 3 n=2 Tax=Serpula lacrymans var. lacrymans TaxID=341189 RepID=F8PFA5_SERL3|nr:uncharacterized protein SERLADRAFT_454451 [Serpula lacrymans var. lacrymans S7.9]EGO04211.1 hypothetical protein SERLA73DRAFT_173656 [Serpula lacrymans var. lacrymans S7.3]EGO30151.1 hypothetical protein SERLADRAFT_454451 [Serpula lacrymans var. lacrymans S7.9]
MAPSAPKPTRKRNRKRKRRASISSSSSSSSGDASSDEETPKIAPAKKVPPPPEPSESASSSSDSDSDSDVEDTPDVQMAAVAPAETSKKAPPRRQSPSPPPSVVDLPSFLPSKPLGDDREKEVLLKERFRKFWMESLADGFRDDLEEIRKKEPNLGMSRLSLLIDSLASGADVFSSRSGNGDVNEMEVVLENLPT